ncbi:MAG: Trk system potassium transporter TrkA [Bacteroidetes bacterium]|nr:MAG: Trk system potassium transporter TrkA [Bacteroidota bacterium]
MNIIIAGDGELGGYIAKLLAKQNHNITMINPNKEFIEEIDAHLDLLTIEGDATQIEILRDAKVNKADLVISVMHEEQPNIVTALIAKKLGAKRTIARVSNIDNLSKENKAFFRELGIDNLISPEFIASEEIVSLLKESAADEIFDFSEGKLSLFSLKLDDRAMVINKSLNEIAAEHHDLNFRAVAVHRQGKTIIPRGDFRFQTNDLAYIITKPEGFEQIMKMGGREKLKIKNIMIVGGGRIGRLAAQRLESEMNIKLIEIDKNRCFDLSDMLNDTLILNGDSRDLELLEDEGIASMDAFISVTRDSETNILTCLLAKRLGVKRTIALIDNLDFIDVAQNIGIDTIINKKLIAASYVENYTLGENVSLIKCLSGVEAEVLELVAKEGSYITKKPIHNLRLPEDAIIGGLVRDNKGYIALGKTQIQANDKVVIFTLPSAVTKISKLFI